MLVPENLEDLLSAGLTQYRTSRQCFHNSGEIRWGRNRQVTSVLADLVEVEPLAELIPPDDTQPLRHQRQRLEAVLAAAIERVRSEPRFPPSVPDEDLVNALAQYLELDILERQALLECNGVLARCRALIDVLEMKLQAPRGWDGKLTH